MVAGVAPPPSSHFSSPLSRSVFLRHAARPIRWNPDIMRRDSETLRKPSGRGCGNRQSSASLPPGTSLASLFSCCPTQQPYAAIKKLRGRLPKPSHGPSFCGRWSIPAHIFHLPESSPAAHFPDALLSKPNVISQAPKSLAQPRTRGRRKLPSNKSLLPESSLSPHLALPRLAPQRRNSKIMGRAPKSSQDPGITVAGAPPCPSPSSEFSFRVPRFPRDRAPQPFAATRE